MVQFCSLEALHTWMKNTGSMNQANQCLDLKYKSKCICIILFFFYLFSIYHFWVFVVNSSTRRTNSPHLLITIRYGQFRRTSTSRAEFDLWLVHLQKERFAEIKPLTFFLHNNSYSSVYVSGNKRCRVMTLVRIGTDHLTVSSQTNAYLTLRSPVELTRNFAVVWMPQH